MSEASLPWRSSVPAAPPQLCLPAEPLDAPTLSPGYSSPGHWPGPSPEEAATFIDSPWRSSPKWLNFIFAEHFLSNRVPGALGWGQKIH